MRRLTRKGWLWVGGIVVALAVVGNLGNSSASNAEPAGVGATSSVPSASPSASAASSSASRSTQPSPVAPSPATPSPTKPSTPPATAPAAPPVTTSSAPPTTPATKPAVTPDAVAPVAPPAPAQGTAAATLAALPVKGRAAKTGYARDLFALWTDTDRNGCDARNDTLRRDLTNWAAKAGTRGCVVLTGTLNDPYTGKAINFVRGATSSSDVQIDHVVALSNAWQTGAQQWDAARRAAFGSDPLNLLAVSGPANQQKGDGDAATWLPSNKSFRCAYVARQISVKAKYGLAVTQPEHDAMQRILGACPNEPSVADPAVAALASLAQTAKETAPKQPEADAAEAAPASSSPVAPLVAPSGAGSAPGSVSYKNCRAVWDAIGRPITTSDPGFSTKFDGDGDGVGCESKPR